MDQIRQELSQRLVERVYRDGDWSRKWWMTFVKRSFMNLELTLVSPVCFRLCRTNTPTGTLFFLLFDYPTQLVEPFTTRDSVPNARLLRGSDVRSAAVPHFGVQQRKPSQCIHVHAQQIQHQLPIIARQARNHASTCDMK